MSKGLNLWFLAFPPQLDIEEANDLMKSFLEEVGSTVQKIGQQERLLQEISVAEAVSQLQEEKAQNLQNLEIFLNSILKLIDLGANPNLSTETHKSTALHFAAYFKSQRIFDSLLQSGASIIARDVYGDTPIKYCNLQTIAGKPHLSLEKVTEKNIVLDEAVGIAEISRLVSGRIEDRYLHLLLRKFGKIPHLHENNQTLLHFLISKSLPFSLIVALQSFREDSGVIDPAILNAQDSKGNTPLHLALLLERKDLGFSIARCLIYEGADYKNIRNSSNQNCSEIIQSYPDERVKKEIINRESRQIKVDDVRTAIVRLDSFFSMNYLLAQRGFKLNYYQTIQECCDREQDRLLLMLSDKSLAKVDDFTPENYAMNWCLRRGYDNLLGFKQDRVIRHDSHSYFLDNLDYLTNLMAELVKRGASPQIKDPLGNSPLHYACFLKLENALEIFLAHGANLEDLNHEYIPARYFGENQTVQNRVVLNFPPRLPRVSQVRKVAAEKKPSAKSLESTAKAQAPELTAQEIWSNHLRDARKIAFLGHSQNLSSAFRRDLERIIDDQNEENQVDLDLKISGNNSALMILTKLGFFDLAQKLIAKGAEINARNDKGDSALNLAFASGNKDFITLIFAAPNLHFQSSANDLVKGISSRDFKFAGGILKIEALAKFVAQASGQERQDLVKNLRSVCALKFKGNFEKVRKDFIEFEARVAAEAKKITVKEVKKATPEKLENRLMRKEEKERRQFEEDEKIALAVQREIEGFEREIMSQEEAFKRSSDFFEESKKVQKKQMSEFLQSPERINALTDLPQFLQEKLQPLFDSQAVIFIKGSTVYYKSDADQILDIKPRKPRIPRDLDLEILIERFAEKSDAEIIDFVRNNFSVVITKKEIFRGKDNETLTVNVKDSENKIDISIYDSRPEMLQTQMPFDWVTSKERKIFFRHPDGVAELKRSRGLESFLRHDFDDRQDFVINRSARFFTLRLAFAQTIGQISDEEVAGEKFKIDILTKVKRDLILKESISDEAADQTYFRIKKFISDRDLNEVESREFLKNFCNLLPQAIFAEGSKINSENRAIYLGITRLQNDLSPSSVLEAGMASNLQQESQKLAVMSSKKQGAEISKF